MNSVRNCPLCFVLFTQYSMFTEDIFFLFCTSIGAQVSTKWNRRKNNNNAHGRTYTQLALSCPLAL